MRPVRSMHGKPEQVAVIVGQQVEIARDQADRADMQRRAAGEGRRGRGIWCVHRPILALRQPIQQPSCDSRPHCDSVAQIAGIHRAGENYAVDNPLGWWLPGDSTLCYTPHEPGMVPADCCESLEMSVDATTVRRIAHLARIAVADDEVEHLRGEINAILAFVEQLSEVDVEGVEPMTSVTPMVMKKRADVVTDGGDADAVLRNAPAREGNYFVGAEGGRVSGGSRLAWPNCGVNDRCAGL